MASLDAQPIAYLFGGSKPWVSADWTASDDTVRGGSSTSQLLISPSSSPPNSTATFRGHLDTRTLGGAGFASQRSASPSLDLDLRPYSGLVLDIARADGKLYALVLKDEVLPARPDGRERSTVSWEAEFRPVEGCAGEKVVLRWGDFKATYRGREKIGAEPLKKGDVKRVSIMMRSFFGEQEGDFELVLKSIAAVKEQDVVPPYRDDPYERMSMEGVDEKLKPTGPARQGWLWWIFGACVKLQIVQDS